MLDAGLAEIYGYSTKRFNEQVKCNIERFDGDFRFQLKKEVYKEILRSEKPTSICRRSLNAEIAAAGNGLIRMDGARKNGRREALP
ncbi:MAG: ORF6N domain-containing protein [Fibrobacter sp.]|nr:ORF6N domain-containing protein [Fibrobacter sp.]